MKTFLIAITILALPATSFAQCPNGQCPTSGPLRFRASSISWSIQAANPTPKASATFVAPAARTETRTQISSVKVATVQTYRSNLQVASLPHPIRKAVTVLRFLLRR